MRNVLADLALEVRGGDAAGAATGARVRRPPAHDEHEALLARVLTPTAKYWVCKRLPAAAAEAMEVMGGNGYVEEGPFARFYREAPLNSIWEGSGNVMCLDVLRALSRVPAVRDALADELGAACGTHRRYDAFVEALNADLARPDLDEGEARAFTERIALATQAALADRAAVRRRPRTRSALHDWRTGAGDAPSAHCRAVSIRHRCWRGLFRHRPGSRDGIRPEARGRNCLPARRRHRRQHEGRCRRLSAGADARVPAAWHDSPADRGTADRAPARAGRRVRHRDPGQQRSRGHACRRSPSSTSTRSATR